MRVTRKCRHRLQRGVAARGADGHAGHRTVVVACRINDRIRVRRAGRPRQQYSRGQHADVSHAAIFLHDLFLDVIEMIVSGDKQSLVPYAENRLPTKKFLLSRLHVLCYTFYGTGTLFLVSRLAGMKSKN